MGFGGEIQIPFCVLMKRPRFLMIGLIMYIDTHKSYPHWGAKRLQELEFFTKLNVQHFVKLAAGIHPYSGISCKY